MKIAWDFCIQTNRFPLRVEKDQPGFIANRVLQFPKAVLLASLLDEGLVQPEEVDAQWRRLGHAIGPYESLDLAGLDVYLNVSEYLAEVLHKDYRPSTVIAEKVKAGELGRKSGKGFYDYSKGKPHIDLNKNTDKIHPMDIKSVTINEATKLIENGLCSAEDIDNASIYGMGNKIGTMTEAINLDPVELTKRLEILAKRFNKEIFRPTRMIREGGFKKM